MKICETVIELLQRYLARTKGSHHHFKHPTKRGLVTIPHPKKMFQKEH